MMRIVVVLAALLLAGCVGRDEPEPDYEPIPDEDLFAQVGELPGVLSAELRWEDSFEVGTGYVGTVHVDETADPVEVLDAATAILYQGRFRAWIYIDAKQGPRTTHLTRIFPRGASPEALEERYGPQPGDGEPPS